MKKVAVEETRNAQITSDEKVEEQKSGGSEPSVGMSSVERCTIQIPLKSIIWQT